MCKFQEMSDLLYHKIVFLCRQKFESMHALELSTPNNVITTCMWSPEAMYIPLMGFYCAVHCNPVCCISSTSMLSAQCAIAFVALAQEGLHGNAKPF